MKGFIAIALCAMLMVPLVATAGDGHHNRKANKGQKIHKMGKELNLSDDQKTQLKAIHEGTRDQRKAIKELPEADRKAAAQKLREETKAKSASVLTAEQRQKLDEMKAAHKAKKK